MTDSDYFELLGLSRRWQGAPVAPWLAAFARAQCEK